MTVQLRDGTRITAKRAVSAIPPVLADSLITWTPALTTSRTKVQKYMRMGVAIKCLIFYERVWWKEKGLSGLYTREPTDDHPVTLVVAGKHPNAKYPALVAFVLGTQGKFKDSDEEQRQKMVVASINASFGVDEVPVDFLMKDWSQEEFSSGCYTGLLPPFLVAQNLTLEELRQPAGLIHWAGEYAPLTDRHRNSNPGPRLLRGRHRGRRQGGQGDLGHNESPAQVGPLAGSHDATPVQQAEMACWRCSRGAVTTDVGALCSLVAQRSSRSRSEHLRRATGCRSSPVCRNM